MDRDTLTITTPVANKVVVLKSYITGREKRALTNIFLTGELQFSTDAKDIKGLKAGLVEQAEDLAFRTVIVSIDGKTEDIVNSVLNLPAQDYSYIVKAVNDITADKKGEEVKKN